MWRRIQRRGCIPFNTNKMFSSEQPWHYMYLKETITNDHLEPV